MGNRNQNPFTNIPQNFYYMQSKIEKIPKYLSNKIYILYTVSKREISNVDKYSTFLLTYMSTTKFIRDPSSYYAYQYIESQISSILYSFPKIINPPLTNTNNIKVFIIMSQRNPSPS